MVTELVEGPMGRNNLRKVLDSTELRPLLSWSLRAPPFFPLPYSLSRKRRSCLV
eukprot:COSAG04_NODE_1968_length_5112_cov_3.258328_5_plen_54_part_00